MKKRETRLAAPREDIFERRLYLFRLALMLSTNLNALLFITCRSKATLQSLRRRDGCDHEIGAPPIFERFASLKRNSVDSSRQLKAPIDTTFHLQAG